MSCVERSKVKLNSYQKKVVYFLSSRKNRGLLVVHPPGSGKTLTAVTYSQCFLDMFPDQEVIVITPSSLKSNFRKGLREYGVSEKDLKKYKIYSFDKFSKEKGNVKCKDNLVIIDEVHNLRNMGLGSHTSGVRAKAALACVYRAKKILLLTATPFVNDLTDLISMVNLVHGGNAMITKKSQIKEVADLKPYLRGYVDYVKPVYDSNYPKMDEHMIKIKMPKSYEEDYCKLIRGQLVNESVFSSPRSFYNAHRRAVNKVGARSEFLSLKIKKAIELIGDQKSVIYSNWLDYGLDPIGDALDEAGISFEGYRGDISESEKNEIKDIFDRDEVQVLITSPTGKEGLDLIGVRNVIIMDPPWNYAGVKQIRERARRYGSHSHLPKKERHVNVYYLSLETSSAAQDRGCFSGDTIVYGIVEKKKILDEMINKMLEEVSI